MSDVEKRFHEIWLGMVQPVEGLVVSVPVLVDAQCIQRQPPAVQTKLLSLCPATREGEAGPEGHTITNLRSFLEGMLELTPDLFDDSEAQPDELLLYVPEGHQILRPTLALRKLDADGNPPSGGEEADDSTPASRAGSSYEALIWDLEAEAGAQGRGLALDKAEAITGPWEYPPTAKFDRLLRACRVPIGILTNREVVRLIYAPHGESSGHMTFKIDDLVTVGGRPILDAFIMLLSVNRFFGVAEDRALPALLAESRKRQANVTNELAAQVFDALQILLRGFEAAAERDGHHVLADALERENDHLYKGLLSVLLRLVFLLYAEDRGLMPTECTVYAEHLSVLGLFERLQSDHGAYPDSMSRRFGAWGQLVSLFRGVFLGVDHGDLTMPPRRGALFDPNTYPFLEGWGPAGAAPIAMAENRAAVKVPTLDDETVYHVLEKLIVFEGQRLSYRTLDVEQIGSVYEALMGFHVERVSERAVCMRPDGLWVTAEQVLDIPAARRAKWLKDTVGLAKAQAEKLSTELKDAADVDAVFERLAEYRMGGRKRDPALYVAQLGQLVLQPGAERRRTSSHYTPRSLSAPIVKRTLEPLLAAMGESPSSEGILSLKICDPAMGSGAFLVEACRFLGDQVVAAWTREGKLEQVAHDAPNEDPVLHARRMVAQRCLYGVDKNDAAVELAKLSLWLVTLARDLPFTFLDHALRHGDSLVGLDFDQIKSFHWKPGAQLELASSVLTEALDEAILIRQQILDLAGDPTPAAQREKERLTRDADDASDRARLIADVVVGAFFAETKDKAREKERLRRLDLVQAWLDGDEASLIELRGLQAEIRERLPVFHWMLEFPEVFYAERPDPLDEGRVNGAAFMDAFVGNPPFAGKNAIIESGGQAYLPWLQEIHEPAHGNADISAHFFRRSNVLLGEHGTVGLIATNTIAQGDTRQTGLQNLVSSGATVYNAITSMMWPGQAAVAVSVVHLAKGKSRGNAFPFRLNGRACDAIDSRLRDRPERPDPTQLYVNKGRAFVGSYILGAGFFIGDDERAQLVAKHPRNETRIKSCIGGEAFNSSPTQAFDRYVISFGQASKEEAEGWPDLMTILRERVKPERDKNNRDTRRVHWWRFGEPAPALYRALSERTRCLAVSNVGRHVAFAFQPTDRVFTHSLVVFDVCSDAAFAILQSRIHLAWTQLFSATMKLDQRYMPSDCFGTFPFPYREPDHESRALADAGSRVYVNRAQYMIENSVGLTSCYHRLKTSVSNADTSIEYLRKLHEDMDRAVLTAYGWNDVEVPPFCPRNRADEKALAAFQDEVIDRLFVLNAARADEERKQGLSGKVAKQKRAKSKPKAKPAKSKDQGDLGFG